MKIEQQRTPADLPRLRKPMVGLAKLQKAVDKGLHNSWCALGHDPVFTSRATFQVITLSPIREVLESDESVVIPCWALDSRGGRLMWKPEHRIAAERSGLRYPSDLSDTEWALVAPLIPPGKHGGRKRTSDVREVLNAIFYVLWTGCQWQALPKEFPPKSTVWDYFDLWTWNGTLERIHHAVYVAVREREGRQASPSVAIIDSQSAKGAQKGGLRSTRRASMRARRSRAASAISLSIRSAFC